MSRRVPAPFTILVLGALLVFAAPAAGSSSANKAPRIVSLSKPSVAGYFDGRTTVSFEFRLCDDSQGRFRVYLKQARLASGRWHSRPWSSFPLIEHHGGCFTYGFERPAAWGLKVAADAWRITVRVQDSRGLLSRPKSATLWGDV